MSDNEKRPEDKAKKNKKKKANKNTVANPTANPPANISSALAGLDSAIFSQLGSLMGQEKEIDFAKFEESEKNVRDEMESIKVILANIQNDKFDEFPDQEPIVNNTGHKSEMDPQRKRLLGEFAKKIRSFEDDLKRVEQTSNELGPNSDLAHFLDGLKENLSDDIRRNKELYKKFEGI